LPGAQGTWAGERQARASQEDTAVRDCACSPSPWAERFSSSTEQSAVDHHDKIFSIDHGQIALSLESLLDRVHHRFQERSAHMTATGDVQHPVASAAQIDFHQRSGDSLRVRPFY